MKQHAQISSLRGVRKAARQYRDLNSYSGLLRYARNDKEAGNALIFILIAIVLLGLLTVTLTRSGDSTNDTGDFEQNQIAASEILTYAKSIENAVQSLLARGCSENEISFWHDSDGNGTEDGSDDYYNDKSPTDRSCHVFDVSGVGLNYFQINEDYFDSNQSTETLYGENYFPSSVCVQNVGSGSTNCQSNGVNDEEILIFIPYLKENICKSINTSLTGSSDIPKDTGAMWPNDHSKFTGNLSDGNSITLLGGYHGTSSLCIEGDTRPVAGTYHFYHVLHAR